MLKTMKRTDSSMLKQNGCGKRASVLRYSQAKPGTKTTKEMDEFIDPEAVPPMKKMRIRVITRVKKKKNRTRSQLTRNLKKKMTRFHSFDNLQINDSRRKPKATNINCHIFRIILIAMPASFGK